MIDILLSPVVGAFIGYFTNWLAIKMIFRPFEPKYIFGIRIPFTPGLIPKSKGEISRKIAKTIVSHLLTTEKLHVLFDNEDFKNSLNQTVNKIVDKAFEDLIESFKKSLSDEVKIGFIQGMITNLSERLKEKLKPKITEKLSSHIESGVEDYLKGDFITVLAKIDLEGMIYDTLMEVDIQTLEEIILGFSKKQLKYITNLGGVLGFIIGVFQVILSKIF
ncbi:MAG: DUF445 family protein [Hydrogenothermaceae bacterium]